MTLKDIAKEAGVSISTVSRVINNKDTNVASRNVQDRIWRIVRRTGYTPNKNAQSLRKASPMVCELPSKKLLACVYARSFDTTSDMFFSELEKAIEQEAFKNGYHVKYFFYAKDITGHQFSEIVKADAVDGIVVLGRFDADRLSFITESQKNVVYAGLNDVNTTKHDFIFCDGYKASQAAMQHLYNLGHRHIAYIGERNKENRYRGYYDVLKKYQLPSHADYIVNVMLSPDGGYKGAKELISRNTDATAIFCANDATAVGAIKALKESGLSIPQNISIIGIDDIEMAQYVSPMLTTVHIPIDELGKQATKTLIDRIAKGHVLPMRTELPFYISNRDSCSTPHVGK